MGVCAASAPEGSEVRQLATSVQSASASVPFARRWATRQAPTKPARLVRVARSGTECAFYRTARRVADDITSGYEAGVRR